MKQISLAETYIDATFVRSKAGKQLVCNTKCGKGHKLMAICDDKSRPLALLLESASRSEIKLVFDTLDCLATKQKPQRIIADRAYDSDKHDAELKKLFVSLSWWGRDCYCVGSANLLSCGTCGNRFDKWLENYDGVIDHKYVFSEMGYNLKPLDLQGAIGLVQLDKLNEIKTNRKISNERISKIFTNNIPNIRVPTVLDKAEPCWFGTPFICDEPGLKHRLVEYLEANKIQTRNYFAGNILLHPGYSLLDDYNLYPEANKVLDKVFFIGAAPHYTEPVFNYIEETIKNFK
jgi:hypothetical protein